jgi:hypothetical protein
MCAIGALFSVIAMKANAVVNRLSFYREVRKSYAHFDANGVLHGLWEINAKSVENFAAWLASEAVNGTRPMFRVSGSDYNDDGSYRRTVEARSSTDAVMRNLNLDPLTVRTFVEDINNSGDKISFGIKFYPLDDKIPVTALFRDEVEAVFYGILKNNVSPTVAEAIAKDVAKDAGTYASFEDIKKIRSWKNAFQNDANLENGMASKIGEWVTFNKEVKQINFLFAPLYVQNVMCELFKKKYNRTRPAYVDQIDFRYSQHSVKFANNVRWKNNINGLAELFGEAISSGFFPSPVTVYTLAWEPAALQRSNSALQMGVHSFSNVVGADVDVFRVASGRLISHRELVIKK